MIILKKAFSFFISISLIIMLFSCDGSETSGTLSATGEMLITVNVKGTSPADVRFEPNRINLKKGAKVKLTLNNQLKGEGMYENWVLVNLGAGQEVVNDAMAAGSDNNYVAYGKNVIVSSPLAAPGQSVVVGFTAPGSGSYNYISTFPGNFPKMIGKLVVE
jgi:azurin